MSAVRARHRPPCPAPGEICSRGGANGVRFRRRNAFVRHSHHGSHASSCRDGGALSADVFRSEEQTSELQSLMRNSYAVFCLKKKTTHLYHRHYSHNTINYMIVSQLPLH